MKKGCDYEPYEVPKVPKDFLRYASRKFKETVAR